VATSYNNIGSVCDNKGEYDKALDFYQKCLDIRLKTLGEDHPKVANAFWNIGLCLQKSEDFSSAIKAFNNGYKIQCKGGYPFRIASCHEQLGNKIEALDYFIQSAEIRKENPEAGLTNEATIESIENAKRIAKELGKESELPEWIINLNT
jgi:tetratricopeptide (TPR) repeat protein